VIWHRHSVTVSACRWAYLPFAALAAIHLGGPQGDTARLTVEDSRVDGTESGVPQPDRLADTLGSSDAERIAAHASRGPR
jgi:hypothetical protein